MIDRSFPLAEAAAALKYMHANAHFGKIVQAAIEGHASTLYSEDMRHGQTLDSLRVVNPFS